MVLRGGLSPRKGYKQNKDGGGQMDICGLLEDLKAKDTSSGNAFLIHAMGRAYPAATSLMSLLVSSSKLLVAVLMF